MAKKNKPDEEQKEQGGPAPEGGGGEQKPDSAGKRALLHVPISDELAEELKAYGDEHRIGVRGAQRHAEEHLAGMIGSPEAAASFASSLRDSARQRRIEFHRQELAKLEANG